MKKLPVCKLCGKVGHYQYACYQRNKLLYQKRKTEGKIKKPKPLSQSKKKDYSERRKLIKELDKYTSLICRLGASDKNGYATCYSCGARLFWRQVDCGHYVSRRFTQTRWDLGNVRPQCQLCNRYKNGNYPAYEAHLKRDIGIDGMQKLWDKAYKRTKFQTYELNEMLVNLKKEYKALVEKRKAKGWKC